MLRTTDVHIQEVREWSTGAVGFEDLEWLLNRYQKLYGEPTVSNPTERTVLYVFKGGKMTYNITIHQEETQNPT